MAALIAHRPEIENVSALQDLLNRNNRFTKQSQVDLFEAAEWHESLDDAQIEHYLSLGKNGNLSQKVKLRVFFIAAGERQNWIPSVTAASLMMLRKTYEVPVPFIKAITGVPSTGMGCFVERGNGGDMIALQVFYSFKNGIDGNYGGAYFRYDFEEMAVTYVCFNCPHFATHRLINGTGWENNSSPIGKPFLLDILIADEVLGNFSEEVGLLRLALLKYEASGVITDSSASTSELHGLSQSWHRLQAHLRRYEDRTKFLLAAHGKLSRLRESHESHGNANFSRQYEEINDIMEYLLSTSQGSSVWVSGYNDRTNVQINLLFNLASQKDNKVNVKTAVKTSQIAEETRRDSSSMITIAAVTMFFLPATSVCAIFSTVFFHLEKGNDGAEILAVSKKLWLFVVVTVPLTLGVFGTWLGWQRWRAQGIRRKEDDARWLLDEHLEKE